MLINFNETLKDLDGEPIPAVRVEGNAVVKDGDKKVTLGSIATTALLADYEDEKGLSGDDKCKRFMIATKIHGEGLPVDLPVEDVSLIKRLVAKRHTALVVGQAWALLDPKPMAVEKVS